jgi:hypothetical protein
MPSQATESLFANIINADFCNTIGPTATLPPALDGVSC